MPSARGTVSARRSSRAASIAPSSSAASAAAPPTAAPPDPFIASVLALDDSVDALPQLRDTALSTLSSARMPTTRQEAFRFTDISPLVRRSVVAPEAHDPEAVASVVASCTLPAADSSRVVIVDGRFSSELSRLEGLPEGVRVTSVTGADVGVGIQSGARGGVFAQLNGATAPGCVKIELDNGAQCDAPIHVVHVSTGSAPDTSVAVSAPRLSIHAAASSDVEVVEEFAGLPDGPGNYLVNSVTEIHVDQQARVRHDLVETDARSAFFVKGTFVNQAENSTYNLVETRLGGQLSRHDVDVLQEGPSTQTTMKHFLLCSNNQLHDLHTQLVLDYPEGEADQLHKCIVSDASGRGVFDGNVQVRKNAQQTDAGQLSRNLLLVPKATVNVKPNLQIIADDVKCTHGCAVSDLSADEMFYFRSRGIDAQSARKALVFSFGAEVVQQLGHKELVERVQKSVNGMLDAAAL